MTRDQDETTGAMTELEKLDAGLEYCFDDPEVAARKQAAPLACRELDAIDPRDAQARDAARAPCSAPAARSSTSRRARDRDQAAGPLRVTGGRLPPVAFGSG
ncbi:hypothetical protein [Brachybacterium sp. GPGPB12]|uniref:hypothetical protein n=1 Tax=Brachybacterium sp. GPGPB12 TaxID=3023517 RepID=UPI0031345E0F